MFPPTLKGSLVSAHVVPWSDERRIEPSLGSQELVYIPTARYNFSVFTGSVAKASIPQSCLISQSLSPLMKRPFTSLCHSRNQAMVSMYHRRSTCMPHRYLHEHRLAPFQRDWTQCREWNLHRLQIKSVHWISSRELKQRPPPIRTFFQLKDCDEIADVEAARRLAASAIPCKTNMTLILNRMNSAETWQFKRNVLVAFVLKYLPARHPSIH
jgi:hypothetical protein